MISKQTNKPIDQTNPLSNFFRKSKLSITLPSHGKWYAENSLKINEKGELPVFAMNASDDIKFRTGDATLSGQNIFDVIKSCVPGITEPENIPHIDLDTIVLAIRAASYGSEFDFTVNVPETNLTRTIKINAIDLLNKMASIKDAWDEEINIKDENDQTLSLIVTPVPIKKIFETSKAIFNQRQNLSRNVDDNNNIKDDSVFTASINALSRSSIDLLCSSIKQLAVKDNKGNVLLSINSSNPQDAAKIVSNINEMDIAYFNAIREHVNNQRKKYIFVSPKQESSADEIAAGAPKTWTCELSFMGSSFIPSIEA